MRIVYLLLLTLLVISCNDDDVNEECIEDCVTFQGKISSGLNSMDPVEDAELSFEWNSPGIISNSRIIATGLSDSDGSYTFTFSPQDGELLEGKFKLFSKKNDFWKSSKTHQEIVEIDGNYDLSVHMPSKSQLKLLLKDFDPIHETDVFSVIPYFEDYGSETRDVIRLYDNEQQQRNPVFDIDDSPFNILELESEGVGDQYTYFSVLKIKNSVRTEYIDSIYISSGEKGIYESTF